MKKLIKTASIVTSGIIVGALVRKFTTQGLTDKISRMDSVRSVKNIFNTSGNEEADSYFI